MGQFMLSALFVAVMVFALVDIITSDTWRVRFLPKIAWAIMVILLPLIGSILWFVLGKERQGSSTLGSFGDPRRQEAAHEAVRRESTTEDDLAAVEREIEYHEKQAEIRRLEAKLRAKRDQAE